MSSLTDEALSSVVRHCPNLTSLYVSLHKYVTGTSLLPLLREPERAKKLRCLNLSCKSVRDFVLQTVALYLHNFKSGIKTHSFRDKTDK